MYTKIGKYHIVAWQMYWKHWYKLWPWYKEFESPEDLQFTYNSTDFVFCIGPLQIRGYFV